MIYQRRMRQIDAGIKHGNFDWTVGSGSFVNLVRGCQVNYFRRPLSHIGAIVATNTPGIAATFGRFLNEVRFSEDDPNITRQRGDAIFNGSVVGNPQPIDWPG